MQEVDLLLVEDDPGDIELAKIALQETSGQFHYHVVRDGKEALDFLFSRGKYLHNTTIPKLILLDLKLPKVNGKEVLQALKNHQPTKHIPVVMLTSSAESKDIQECYQLGANGYLVKPIDFDDFLQTIRTVTNYWMNVNTATG